MRDTGACIALSNMPNCVLVVKLRVRLYHSPGSPPKRSFRALQKFSCDSTGRALLVNKEPTRAANVYIIYRRIISVLLVG